MKGCILIANEAINFSFLWPVQVLRAYTFQQLNNSTDFYWCDVRGYAVYAKYADGDCSVGFVN